MALSGLSRLRLQQLILCCVEASRGNVARQREVCHALEALGLWAWGNDRPPAKQGKGTGPLWKRRFGELLGRLREILVEELSCN